MELTRLIEALSHPAAYPYAVDKVEVRQTHISVVFLAGAYAYKIKKPVNLGFLDFTSLEKRCHFCHEEVRLNRRLAPSVYQGVAPVARTATGIRLEGNGEVIEWSVKMERLPDEATLLHQLLRGEAHAALVEALARKIASFHVQAEGGEQAAAFGRFDVVARNALENFEQIARQVGVVVSSAVFERLRKLTEHQLAQFRPLIERRARCGMPRDTHGDLHLEHVYLFPEREPPGDLVIIDCIEFNERFRFTDPVADMAFLYMDLRFHNRRDLSQAFADAYFRASKDEEGRLLLPFYTAYRAAVRGKVEGLKSEEQEIPQSERLQALAGARGHWLLALAELEEPNNKPCLILIGGLPGTGKSTLARSLSVQAGFSLLRSDLIRKELAGVAAPAAAAFGEGLYTQAWTESTYAECLRRSERLLFEGKRVIVDASFGEERRRRDFSDLATDLALPVVFLHCKADPNVVRQRLRLRRGDASDADWRIHQEAARRWQEPGCVTTQILREIRCGGTEEETLLQAHAALREFSLAD